MATDFWDLGFGVDIKVEDDLLNALLAEIQKTIDQNWPATVWDWQFTGDGIHVRTSAAEAGVWLKMIF